MRTAVLKAQRIAEQTLLRNVFLATLTQFRDLGAEQEYQQFFALSSIHESVIWFRILGGWAGLSALRSLTKMDPWLPLTLLGLLPVLVLNHLKGINRLDLIERLNLVCCHFMLVPQGAWAMGLLQVPRLPELVLRNTLAHMLYFIVTAYGHPIRFKHSIYSFLFFTLVHSKLYWMMRLPWPVFQAVASNIFRAGVIFFLDYRWRVAFSRQRSKELAVASLDALSNSQAHRDQRDVAMFSDTELCNLLRYYNSTAYRDEATSCSKLMPFTSIYLRIPEGDPWQLDKQASDKLKNKFETVYGMLQVLNVTVHPTSSR